MMRSARTLMLTALFLFATALPAFAQTSDILSPLTRWWRPSERPSPGLSAWRYPLSRWPQRP